MPILRIQVFGDFRLIDGDDGFITLNQTRQQALLAYLLLHRDAPQVRQHLAFLLWPDSSETQALTNLRKALTYLRQNAPMLTQAIHADHKVMQWRPTFPYTLDVAEFEAKLAQATLAEQIGDVGEKLAALAAAVEIYAGPLLPSCYDDWLIAERERLHQLCLKSLEQLVTLHELQRDFVKAIHYAQHLLRLDPLQETMYLQLMRLQALQGDRAGALRTYHSCATILEHELGVEPGEETQAAYARLLKLEIPVTPRPMASRSPGAPAARLVGRQAEWNQLQTAWRLATQHSAHFVFIRGEAGIGKTHLAEAMLAWAGQQGFTVARTRAYAGEGQLAYAPIVEWLRAEPMRAARQRLAKVWLSEVARLVPEILSEQPTIPAPVPMNERWQRQQMWEALVRALLAAPQPLLLVFDDLQWCDQETLEWLRYLLHFEPRARLLVLGTARPEEIDEAHPLPALLRLLRSADQLTELELGPLDAEQTAVLAAQVAQHTLTPERQQALYHATTGNPLFVVETVRAGLSNGHETIGIIGVEETAPLLPYSPTPLPPKVQAVIESRLVRLSPTARSLAHLAAVIGRAFSFELLVQASGQEEDTIIRALDELWQRRIIREQGTHTYDFSHDRIRDVAYAEISPIRRRQLHRQVAVALEQHHAAGLDTISNSLAFHYAQAGLSEQALVYYQRAAKVARALYAYHEAALYVQHGLTLLKLLPATREAQREELGLLILLGELLCAALGFAASEVGATYDKALALCQQVGNQTQIYTVQHGLLWYYLNRGDFKLARHFAEANLALVEALQDQAIKYDAHTSLGLVQLHIGEPTAALQQFEHVLTLFGHSHADITQLEVYAIPNAFAWSAICLWLIGYPDQAQQRARHTLSLIQSYANPVGVVVVLEFTLIVNHLIHDEHAMRTQAEEMATIATKYSVPMYQALGMLYTGFTRAYHGEITAGIAQLKQGLDAVRQTGVISFTPYCLALLAEVYGLAGQNADALRVLDAALAIVDQTGEAWWQAELFRHRGQLLLASGASERDVEVWYQRALQVTRQQQTKSLELRATISLARLWQQQGRVVEAYERLAEIYQWFTEGFDSVDLRTAKALLAELQNTAA